MPYDFSQTLPAIDQNLCNVWSEEDQNKYNKLPYYLVKAEAEARKRWQTFTPLLTDTVKWTPNMGETMRIVQVEQSPLIRQEARPNRITQDPLEDIFNVNERTTDAVLYWQDFSSPHFRFLPAFQDFMKGNLVPSRQNIESQVRMFEDIFYRTYIWDWSPNVYIAGKGLVQAPVGPNAKTAAWLASVLQDVPVASSFMDFKELFKLASIAEEEVGMTPYEGSGQPGGDSQPLNERFCWITSSQAWNQFVDDPWLKENRPLNMNIVNEGYRGDFWGKIRCKLEKTPMRAALDGNFSPTFHAPEIRETNPNAADYNRTKPNPNYARIDISELEWGWFVGGKHYRRIESGPPPEFFAGATSDPSKIAGMTWNGQVYSTRNFLIPCKDADGTVQYKTNDRGRYVRFQGSLNLGITGPNAFNIIPTLYRRRLGTNTVLQTT